MVHRSDNENKSKREDMIDSARTLPSHLSITEYLYHDSIAPIYLRPTPVKRVMQVGSVDQRVVTIVLSWVRTRIRRIYHRIYQAAIMWKIRINGSFSSSFHHYHHRRIKQLSKQKIAWRILVLSSLFCLLLSSVLAAASTSSGSGSKINILYSHDTYYDDDHDDNYRRYVEDESSSFESKNDLVEETKHDSKKDKADHEKIGEPCKDVTLILLMDAYPNEIGYTLVCNKRKTVLWNVTEGSLLQYNAFEIMFETALCVQTTSTCTFTITDSTGDGLTTVENDRPAGYFAILYGNATIASYDGSHGYPDSYFKKLSYCFGPYCSKYDHNEDTDDTDDTYNGNDKYYEDDTKKEVEDMKPPEITGHSFGDKNNTIETCDATNEVLLHLYLTVDEFPAETSYKLTCKSDSSRTNVEGIVVYADMVDNNNSEVTIWDAPPGTFPSMNPYASYHNVTCLRIGGTTKLVTTPVQTKVLKGLQCCTFTIYDAWGDGITSPQENLPGSFQLWYESAFSNQPAVNVAMYDGSNPNITLSHFLELSYTIGGPECQF